MFRCFTVSCFTEVIISVLQVDIGTQILTQDEDNILDEVMRLETMQEKEIDYDIEMKLSQQFSTLHVRESVEKPDTLAHVRFSNNVIETNASSLVEDYYACENDENGAVGAGGGGYEATSAERRLQGLMVEKGLVGMPGMTDEEVDMLMIDINQSAKTAGDKEVRITGPYSFLKNLVLSESNSSTA